MFTHRLSRRSQLLAAVALAGATLAAPAALASVEGPRLAQIPAVPGSLAVLRFTPDGVGQSFVREAIGRAAPEAAEAAVNGVTRFRAADRLLAYATPDGNDFEMFADLPHLPAGALRAQAAARVARGVFARPDVIPHDDTTLALASPARLFGGASGGRAGQVLTYIAATRLVDGLPVLGEGSRASVGVANDGSVQAFVKHWRPAVRAEQVTPTRHPAAVRDAIVQQLSRFETPSTHVVVTRVGLGYYDGQGSVLQPVYYFTARLLPRFGTAGRDGDAVIGYLPVGTAVEALPDLSGAGASPLPLHAAAGQNGGSTGFGIAGGTTVGAYVVNDSANQQAWDNDGYFMAEDIVAAGGSFPQYYFAQPSMYTTYANGYVNSVDWAVTEAHGDWWLFTTLNNNANFVYLSQIGASGNPAFGGYHSSGHMAHWLIHSCEVIPSMFDESIASGNSQNAFNVWWNIFGGLHQALGYRTVMYIADGAGPAYGRDLEQNADVTSAWLNTVTSLPDYTNLNSTYLDYHLNRQVPYGMASVMTIPNLANETAFSNAPSLPARSTGLYNYWVTGPTD